MPYPVTQLITNSYYMSGIVSRDLETVSGPQFADGLARLNDIIGDTRINKGMVPYFRPLDFVATIGQEEYYFPRLIEASTITFFLNNVRYSMVHVDRDIWFGASKALNIQSLPGIFHVERTFNTDPLVIPSGPGPVIGGGAKVYVYYVPSQNYPMQIWGKFDLTEVALNDDLSLGYDRFYINYWKYKLTEFLCDDYDYDVPDRVAQQLEEYEDAIDKNSAVLDMSVVKISTLDDKNSYINYAISNLGRGFLPQ